MADLAEARKQLSQLKTWQAQWAGLVLVPPIVDELLKLLDEREARLTALQTQETVLRKETEGLTDEISAKRAAAETKIRAEHEALMAALRKDSEALARDNAKATASLEEVNKRVTTKTQHLASLDAEIEKRETELKKLREAAETFRRAAESTR